MRQLEVPKILVDEESTRIILAALYRPRTALEISTATGVPVAVTFSRVKVLVSKGYLKVDGHRTDHRGRDTPTFVSTLRDGFMFLEQGRLKARFQLVAAIPEAFHDPSVLL